MPRPFWLSTSILFHGGFLFLFWEGSFQGREELKQTISLKTGLVKEKFQILQEEKGERLLPEFTPMPIEAQKPIPYAGAPSNAVEEEPTEDEQTVDKTKSSTVGADSLTDGTSKNLLDSRPRAEKIIEKGEKFPGYVLTNLDEEMIYKIVKSGQGKVIGIGGEKEDAERFFISVKWTRSGPEGFQVVTSESWMDGMSRRALELPPLIERRIRSAVKKELGLSLQSAMVFLNHPFDRRILAEQVRACRETGLDFQNVRKTVGRLFIGRSERGNYRVESFEMNDGTILPRRSKQVVSGNRSEWGEGHGASSFK